VDSRSLINAAGVALLDERRQLTADELRELAALPDEAVPQLAALAHEVRLAWSGPTVEVEGILSAKTGGCPEDCHFCSQSAQFETVVQATPFLDTDEVLAAARETAAIGASEFCIVLAVRGPDEKVMQRLEELVPLVQQETGLQVAVSAGILTEEQAARLHAVGTHRYNHNLETSQSFFPNIVTTHSWEERFETCELVRRHGMELCCGVLLGMGELVQPLEAIRWIALFRLALPSVILRYAGGREVTLRELQSLGLTAGINALIIGNYLTTLGRSPEEDLQMLADLRMPIGALSKAI
jgi:biotin synthase